MLDRRRTAADQFRGRRVCVIGFGQTGLATARILVELGAHVNLTDSLNETALGLKMTLAETTGAELLPAASADTALAGVDLVIPSPGVKPSSPVLAAAKSKGIEILSEIEIAWRIAVAPILAVTATNGKTTTALLLEDMLRRSGMTTHIGGNISAGPIKRTLIEAALSARDDEPIVAEISSFQLMHVQQFRPVIGIVLNVTPDHMDWHASFEEYVAAKARLLAAQTSSDVAVVNRLDARARAIGESSRARKFWFDHGRCSADDSACVQEGTLVVRWSGAEYRLCRSDQMKIRGQFNVDNGLAAAGAAIAFGANPEAVEQSLRTFAGAPHRMEAVAVVSGVQYIDSSMTTNVDAAVRCVEALETPVVVIAGGVDKGSEFAPFASALALHARHLVLIGRAADLLEREAKAAGMRSITRAATMTEAVRVASEHAVVGDTVLLCPACASFDMFADFDARGAAFQAAVRGLQDVDGGDEF